MTLSLANARIEAQNLHAVLRTGVDPLEHRRRQHAAQRLEQLKSITFSEAAKKYIASHRDGWKNVKHSEQWTQSLAMHAEPVIGKLPVQDIDTALVMRVLEPIWKTTNETAVRVRGRIESILDWSTVHGYRTGANPARWKGHLDHLLPKPTKVAKVVHHPALPFAHIHEFVTDLRAREGVAARALEFTILCAARTGETLGARWGEIDIEAKRWTISGERMKAGKPTRLPSTPRAIEILASLPRTSDFVFPNERGRKLSDATMAAVLKRMKRVVTVHGFRSTFRDWAGESHVEVPARGHRVVPGARGRQRRREGVRAQRSVRQACATDGGRARYIDTKPGTTGNVISIRSAS